MMDVKWLAGTALLLLATPAFAGTTSVYRTAPTDPRAITVRGVGDGRADDSAAIQQAIDAAAAGGKGGVVFLPSGRYRISRTIFVRSAVRLFGVGPTRPEILL
ncbi:MAG: gluconolaconase, partial [Sphingomonas sp.]